MKRKDSEFPSRLRWAMAAAGVAHQALAERSGVSVSGLKKWLGGISAPRTGKLRPVADVLGVSVGWLLGETEAGGPDREALEEAKSTEWTDQVNRLAPHMKAARAAEERARHDEEDARDEREMGRRFASATAETGQAPSSEKPPVSAAPRLFGTVKTDWLDQAFQEALSHAGIPTAQLGDTNKLMLLTLLLYDARAEREAKLTAARQAKPSTSALEKNNA